MIHALLAAVLLLAAAPAGPAAEATPYLPELSTTEVLEEYADALAAYKSPRILTFEYSLVQSGVKTTDSTHRVFRSGTDERDELLSVDGKRLSPPTVRIFRGRGNRYALEVLVPKTTSYTFRYLGPRKNAHHSDYVFATTPKVPGAFRVTNVTIDGVTFLPNAITFVTSAHKGRGSIAFAHIERYVVPVTADASAAVAKLSSTERISFSHYRFPAALPPSTFFVPRPLPTPKEPAP